MNYGMVWGQVFSHIALVIGQICSLKNLLHEAVVPS